MTDHPAAAVAGSTAPPVARLEPNAIGAAQDTIIGMASSAPAATVGLTLAGLAAGDRLRQRPDPAPHGHPDAHHRQRVPPV
jgi:hypothetical protein